MLVIHEQASAKGISDKERLWVGRGPIARVGRTLSLIISCWGGYSQWCRTPVETSADASVKAGRTDCSKGLNSS
jgi:hypothetical protein